MNEEKKLKFLESLEAFSRDFKESMLAYEMESEDFWSSLSYDEKLYAFCAISRRIHKGEIVDNGSYRYVLYDVFGFGPDAYAVAQMAGYLDIHNAIVPMKESGTNNDEH